MFVLDVLSPKSQKYVLFILWLLLKNAVLSSNE